MSAKILLVLVVSLPFQYCSPVSDSTAAVPASTSGGEENAVPHPKPSKDRGLLHSEELPDYTDNQKHSPEPRGLLGGGGGGGGLLGGVGGLLGGGSKKGNGGDSSPLSAITNTLGGVTNLGGSGNPLDSITKLAGGGGSPLDSISKIAGAGGGPLNSVAANLPLSGLQGLTGQILPIGDLTKAGGLEGTLGQATQLAQGPFAAVDSVQKTGTDLANSATGKKRKTTPPPSDYDDDDEETKRQQEQRRKEKAERKRKRKEEQDRLTKESPNTESTPAPTERQPDSSTKKPQQEPEAKKQAPSNETKPVKLSDFAPATVNLFREDPVATAKKVVQLVIDGKLPRDSEGAKLAIAILKAENSKKA